jgi:hypothetical protein
MHKKYKILSFVALFFLFFVFTLILFPYAILKSWVTSQIQSSLNQSHIGLTAHIETLNEKFPLGVSLKNVEILKNSPHNALPLKFKEIDFTLSLFHIFLGKALIETQLYQDQDDGFASLQIEWPLWTILKGQPQISFIKANFDSFDIEGIISMFLYSLKTSQDPSLALLAPLASSFAIEGNLNGNTSLKIKDKRVTQGFLNLKIDDGFLKTTASNQLFPDQKFKQAQASITWKDDTMTIGPDTILSANQISFQTSGYIKTEKDNSQIAQISINTTLSGEMEKNFGFLIPQIFKCPANTMTQGVMNATLYGQLDQLSCQ